MCGRDWFDFQPFDDESTESYQCELLSVCRDDRLNLEGLVIQMKISGYSCSFRQVISTKCSSNSMFVLVSGRLDLSLCWNPSLVIAHPVQCTDESPLIQSKRGLAASRSLTDRAAWKQLLEHSLVKFRRTQADDFCVCLHVPLLGGFPPLSCACRTMSSGSGCSAVGQLCAGREGSGQRWDEGGSSSLWSHPFWLRPFSQAPKQLLLLLLLTTCVWLSAGAAWYGLKCPYRSKLCFISVAGHQEEVLKHSVSLHQVVIQYYGGFFLWLLVVQCRNDSHF